MKNIYQSSSNYSEFENSSDSNESKIKFLDIVSILIFLISVGFLFESII